MYEIQLFQRSFSIVMVNKTLNENTSSAPPRSVDLYSKNKTPRGIAEKVYPSPLYPSLPAKKLVRNLSLFFVSSFCTIFSRKLQFRFSLCYLSISKINSTLNVAVTACTDRWSLPGSQLKRSRTGSKKIREVQLPVLSL